MLVAPCGDDWVEDISFNVDECSSEINEYLISRRDDPPSDTMSKASIVEEYLTGSVQEEISDGSISDLANQLNKLTIKMGESNINKEALAARKHKVIERQQSIKDQATIKNSGQVSNVSQQQRASTMKDQTNNMLQGNNEEKKKVYYDIPTDFPSQSQRHKTSSRKDLTWDASCLEVASLNHDENVTLMNEADSWIDMLDVFDTTVKTETQPLQNTEISMAWILQQSLPRMKVPIFDGNPLQWVEFITQYKEIVHDQAYLTNNQKFIYLMEHVDGETKRALQVFSANKGGYIMALKRIKCMFGQ